MKRNFWFWLCFIFAIILAIYFSVRIIMTQTGHGNASKIHNISILADGENKNLNDIINATSISKTTPFYKINIEHIKNDVLNVPWVKDASVRRMPNGTLLIHVKLYHAVALWTDGEKYFPLSDDGIIVNKPQPERSQSSILFRGDIPKNNLVEITDATNEIASDIDYLEWIENRRWNIFTNSGIKILLPEDNPIDEVGKLISLNKKYNILHRDISLIDLRDKSRILIW